MKQDFLIRPMTVRDWPEVSRIYLEGIATGHATFETECPSFEAWDAAHLRECRLVATADGSVAGWVALSRVSNRFVYRGVADVSIYIGEAYRRAGCGQALFSALFDLSERIGIWTLQSGVMQDNIASLRLHEKCGFRVIGYRERIGKDSRGVWRNTVLLERRSASDGQQE